MDSVLPILLGYGVGSLPLGYLVASRAKGIDLRRVGSGNVGATNVYRTAGLATALIVILVDVAKGASSVLLRGARCTGGLADPIAAGVAAIIGHVYPVWLRFHGGKGVATACGVFWMLAPLATAVAATLFVLMVWMTRYVSLGSIVATAALPPLAWVTDESMPVVVGGDRGRAADRAAAPGNLARLQRRHRAAAASRARPRGRASLEDRIQRVAVDRGWQLGDGAGHPPGADRARRACSGGAMRRWSPTCESGARMPSICRTSTFRSLLQRRIIPCRQRSQGAGGRRSPCRRTACGACCSRRPRMSPTARWSSARPRASKSDRCCACRR